MDPKCSLKGGTPYQVVQSLSQSCIQRKATKLLTLARLTTPMSLL